MITLLSHYWRDDDPVELTSAIGKDWADVLEGIPHEYIQKACIKYLRTEPRRKPTVGAIYEMARDMMPIKREPSNLRPATKEEDAAYLANVQRDRINPERKAFAERTLADLFPSAREVQ